jgi:hypothetical protein
MGPQNFETVLLTPSDEDMLSTMLTALDDKRLQSLLIGMSFIDNSPFSMAVQQALYALIAFYVYGHARAMRYKVNSITALRYSLQCGLTAKDRLQHIAAGLLLSLYEVGKCALLWQKLFAMSKQIFCRFTTLPSPLTNGYYMLAEPNKLGNKSTRLTRFAKETPESFSHGCSIMMHSTVSVPVTGCPGQIMYRNV